MKTRSLLAGWILMLTAASALPAADAPSDVPNPVPATRPEMKAALEALKEREPRLPLPKPADGEVSVNNGRMRAAYLPEAWGGGGSRGIGGRNSNWRGRPGQDPNAMLEYTFTVPCFWIVSRANNCHYCLEHQELKLRAAGLDDDTIAALDCDWNRFDPRQQAALALARKLTLEPQRLGGEDILKLNSHLSDPEIVELVVTLARFNATNRWTDGMGLPQDRRFNDDRGSSLMTPTSEEFQHRKSIVVPATRAPRPPVATLEQAREAFVACQARSPRVALPSNDQARNVLASVIGERAPWMWERALAQLPENGKAYVTTWNTIMTDDHLAPRLKAELAFITAMNNHAWYAAAHAAHRLQQLGASPEELTSLLGGQEQSQGGAAAAYRLAAKSTTDPHLVADADVAAVRDEFGDAETAQIMQVICMANMFDRFTEALGLPLENGVADGARLSLRRRHER